MVYVCYEEYYDYCNVWKTIVKIVSDKDAAELWVLDFESTETEWRSFEEHEVLPE